MRRYGFTVFGACMASASLLLAWHCSRGLAADAAGALRIHPTNPRYFTDGSGKAVYLTGSHTWSSLQDLGTSDPPAAFDRFYI